MSCNLLFLIECYYPLLYVIVVNWGCVPFSDYTKALIYKKIRILACSCQAFNAQVFNDHKIFFKLLLSFSNWLGLLMSTWIFAGFHHYLWVFLYWQIFNMCILCLKLSKLFKVKKGSKIVWRLKNEQLDCSIVV